MHCRKRIYVVFLFIGCLLGTPFINATPRTFVSQKYYKKKPIPFVKKPQCPQASCPDISKPCKLAALMVTQLICWEAFNEADNKDKPKDFEIIKSEFMDKLWPPSCGPLSTYEDSEGFISNDINKYSFSLKACKDTMTTIIEEKEKKGKETEKTESGQSSSGCPICPEPSKDDCSKNPLGK